MGREMIPETQGWKKIEVNSHGTNIKCLATLSTTDGGCQKAFSGSELPSGRSLYCPY